MQGVGELSGLIGGCIVKRGLRLPEGRTARGLSSWSVCLLFPVPVSALGPFPVQIWGFSGLEGKSLGTSIRKRVIAPIEAWRARKERLCLERALGRAGWNPRFFPKAAEWSTENSATGKTSERARAGTTSRRVGGGEAAQWA